MRYFNCPYCKSQLLDVHANPDGKDVIDGVWISDSNCDNEFWCKKCKKWYILYGNEIIKEEDTE